MVTAARPITTTRLARIPVTKWGQYRVTANELLERVGQVKPCHTEECADRLLADPNLIPEGHGSCIVFPATFRNDGCYCSVTCICKDNGGNWHKSQPWFSNLPYTGILDVNACYLEPTEIAEE